MVTKCVWITGRAGSGKTTLARKLAAQLQNAVVLDGDELRAGLNSDLSFTAADRAENVRRTGEVALILSRAGLLPIVALISPSRAARDAAKAKFDQFCEVFLDVQVDVCAARREIYHRFSADEINGNYEAPVNPSLKNPSADEVLFYIRPEALKNLNGGNNFAVISTNPAPGDVAVRAA